MENKYSLKDYLLPYWDTEIIHNETFLFVGENDEANFLYEPDEILSVRSFQLDVEYVEGVDYEITADKKIRRLTGSKMPFYNLEQFYPKTWWMFKIDLKLDKVPYKLEDAEERYSMYYETSTITRNQIVVTYKHKQKWPFEVPASKAQRFSKTLEKLHNKQAFNMVFYGDSITEGCNASGTKYGGNIPPYCDDYTVLTTKYLQERFDAPVNNFNVAVGGWSTEGGRDNYENKVSPVKPDLLVLAFGMNNIWSSKEDFKAVMAEILDKAYAENPNVEIMVISTTLPNPETTNYGEQETFHIVLDELEKERPYVAHANMTKLHGDLLTIKRFRDMTGNNVNHPNDFMVRAYAQLVLKTLLGEEFTPLK